MRILVVDDVPPIRRAIRGFPEPEGHTVVESGDGAEALRLLDGGTYDLVITDMHMPELDGLKLIQILRKQRSAPRVIAVSGTGEELLLEAARLVGASAVLAKPFTREELLGVVREVSS